jgi:hypothetical protein
MLVAICVEKVVGTSCYRARVAVGLTQSDQLQLFTENLLAAAATTAAASITALQNKSAQGTAPPLMH